MPSLDKPAHTSWIHGSAYGKSYKLRFVDYGIDQVEIELEVEGSRSTVTAKVPRANAINYEKSHHDQVIDDKLQEILKLKGPGTN